MADHKLDAEKMGMGRDPQRLPVREESMERTANIKIAVFWVTLTAVVFGAWVWCLWIRTSCEANRLSTRLSAAMGVSG